MCLPQGNGLWGALSIQVTPTAKHFQMLPPAHMVTAQDVIKASLPITRRVAALAGTQSAASYLGQTKTQSVMMLLSNTVLCNLQSIHQCKCHWLLGY